MGVVLIGYRGSGKTTVGRRLAALLGWPFVDADDVVVARAGGRSIAALFAADGEPAFRELEAAVVRDLVVRRDHVVSLGGGAVLRPDTRAALIAAAHPVVYLRADPETLHARIAADPATAATRPSLTSLTGVDEVRALVTARDAIYRVACTHELDVTHDGPDAVAAAVARLLGGAPAARGLSVSDSPTAT